MELVAQGEIRRLQQVRFDYDEIMRGYRREVDITLTTAASMSPEQVALFKRSIQNDYLKPDDNLIFSHVVDEGLLGGYKVQIRAQEIDQSWAAAVRDAEQAEARVQNAPSEQLAKAPRAIEFDIAEAVKTAVNDKETQGWLPSDLFARSEALRVSFKSREAPFDAAKELALARKLKAEESAKKSPSA